MGVQSVVVFMLIFAPAMVLAWWQLRPGAKGWEPPCWAGPRSKTTIGLSVRLWWRGGVGTALGVIPGLGHLLLGSRRAGLAYFAIFMAVGIGVSAGAAAAVLPVIILVSAAHLMWLDLTRQMPVLEGRVLEMQLAAEEGLASCPRCREAERTAA